MIQITDETFVDEVLNSTVPVLVDVYADWCGPCKAAAPSIEKLADEFAGKAKVVKLNIDTGTEYAVKHGVKGIPNFMIFSGGKLVHQSAGWHPTIEQALRESLTGALTLPAASSELTPESESTETAS